MTPRYSGDGWELHVGDCLAVLPGLTGVDAVVTDPPYEGMSGGVQVHHPGVAKRCAVTVTVGAELGNADGLRLIESVARFGAIVFCSFHWVDKCRAMIGGRSKALVSWYKRNSMPSVNNAPHYLTEYAWAVQYAPGIDWRKLRTHYDIPMLQAGCMAGERIVDGGKSVHPTQKPVELMERVLMPGMDTVLDPYCGLGSTGVACLRTGRRFIGIEIDEHYAQIAAKRLARAEADVRNSLPFPEPEPRPKQAAMWEAV